MSQQPGTAAPRTFSVMLCGQRYTLSRLKMGTVEDLDLLNLQAQSEVVALSRSIDALTAALQAAHPGITRKQVADLVDVDDLALLLPAIMSAAGFEQVQGALGNALGLVVTPGAGAPSTPT